MTGSQHGRAYGDYAWDRWRKRARDAGVTEDLAQLGRGVMREAYQHDWPDSVRTACGWGPDDGQDMIDLALTKPREAFVLWQTLLDTDGGRR